MLYEFNLLTYFVVLVFYTDLHTLDLHAKSKRPSAFPMLS